MRRPDQSYYGARNFSALTIREIREAQTQDREALVSDMEELKAFLPNNVPAALTAYDQAMDGITYAMDGNDSLVQETARARQNDRLIAIANDASMFAKLPYHPDPAILLKALWLAVAAQRIPVVNVLVDWLARYSAHRIGKQIGAFDGFPTA